MMCWLKHGLNAMEDRTRDNRETRLRDVVQISEVPIAQVLIQVSHLPVLHFHVTLCLLEVEDFKPRPPLSEQETFHAAIVLC